MGTKSLVRIFQPKLTSKVQGRPNRDWIKTITLIQIRIAYKINNSSADHRNNHQKIKIEEEIKERIDSKKTENTDGVASRGRSESPRRGLRASTAKFSYAVACALADDHAISTTNSSWITHFKG